ncbi:demethoxyubiquinone hydroxylase family protein [Magnetospira thiophila]
MTLSEQPLRPKRIPGDATGRERIARMLRVDHAGEYGAVRIYQGQLAVLGKSSDKADTVRHMLAQEQQHLETFERMVSTRRVRPTLLTPLWHVAGFALGAGTALLGERAAMACTVAVEEVIDEHYAEQIRDLEQEEPDLSQTFETFRQEELEHRDIGLSHGAEQTPGYELLSSVIKNGSRLAIWLSTRI